MTRAEFIERLVPELEFVHELLNLDTVTGLLEQLAPSIAITLLAETLDSTAEFIEQLGPELESVFMTALEPDIATRIMSAIYAVNYL